MTFLEPVPRETELSFSNDVVGYARLRGWRAYRAKLDGFANVVLIRRPRVVFALVKSERCRVTEHQRAALAELRGCGLEAYLWRPSRRTAIERILK